ncbi:hypothetical protein SAMN02745166_04071 [Prosthecobacter debontii]|uniref:DUF3592 domain-containing protein n=1 Tax=Prosthecobacter debontii TaxID=48467 RepID=A0A1T4YTQ9_9BACT|nr:DUF3592 domain-containing protein [Prosthecobacter debontii]SKB04625.1 hypothetical protein SAMN02745166_04071 [Prosthecobacter debontii]
MLEVLLAILLPILLVCGIIGLIIYQAVTRGYQMRELCDHGVETTGVIREKRSYNPQSGSRRYKLAYTYTDSVGASHSHTSVVTSSVYDQHEEGGPISVVYSSRTPSISAPLYLVEQSRDALKKG